MDMEKDYQKITKNKFAYSRYYTIFEQQLNNTMKKVKFNDNQKRQVSLFLSEQLETLENEKRIGRIRYNNPEIIKTIRKAIEVGIAEEIWNR